MVDGRSTDESDFAQPLVVTLAGHVLDARAWSPPTGGPDMLWPPSTGVRTFSGPHILEAECSKPPTRGRHHPWWSQSLGCAGCCSRLQGRLPRRPQPVRGLRSRRRLRGPPPPPPTPVRVFPSPPQPSTSQTPPSAGTPTYKTAVRPPINADGSSNFAARRGVIPVQFDLLAAPTTTTTTIKTYS